MGDIKRKVEDSKQGNLEPQKPANDGKIEVNWGNAEKIKILLLQAQNNHLAAINNSLAEIVKFIKEAKEKE